MKLNNNAESIAGIIIGVVILSFAMFGIMTIINISRESIYNYNESTNLLLLKKNSENIVKKLNINQILENEKFYIFKNINTKEYEIFTGAINEKYKYIDIKGNTINPNTFEGKVFIREFVKKPDLLKLYIKPNEINNLAFIFSADEINGKNNSNNASGAIVSQWTNLINNEKINASNIGAEYLYGDNYKKLYFSGNEKYFTNYDININGNDDCNTEPKLFEEKSFFLIFETGQNIISEEIILKQGNDQVGYKIYIKDYELKADIYNFTSKTKYWCPGPEQIDFEWSNGNKLVSISYGKIFPQSKYYVTIVHDSTTKDKDGFYIDTENFLKIYGNGILRNKKNGIYPQAENLSFAIGGDTTSNTNYFNGNIYQLLGWNHALNEDEVKGVFNYLNKQSENQLNEQDYYYIETIIDKFTKI